MPMTFAHPLAVVPLKRTGLVFPALIVGSMVPDLPHFAPFVWNYDTSHDVLGSVLCSVVGGLIILGVWEVLLFPALDSTVSQRFRRWPPPRARSQRWWLLSIPSLVIGGWTHLLWDAFTHPGSIVTAWWPIVDQSFLTIPFLMWMQIIHSTLGLAGIAWLIWRWWTRRETQTLQSRPDGRVPSGHAWSRTRDRQILWGFPLVAGGIAALAELVPLLAVPVRLPRPYGHAIFSTGGGTALVAMVLAALMWRLTLHDRGPAED